MPLFPKAQLRDDVYASGTEVSPAGTAGFENLHTIPIGSNLLPANGESLCYEVVTRCAANGNTKSFRMEIGGQYIVTDNFTVNSGVIRHTGRIRRDSATTARCNALIIYGSSSVYQRASTQINVTWANATDLYVAVHTPTATTDAVIESVRFWKERVNA